MATPQNYLAVIKVVGIGGVCDGSLQSGQTFRSGISFGARQRSLA